MKPIRLLPYILKQATRNRVRTLLTAFGISIAMFLFTTVQAMQEGVVAATTETANETTLVVYRKDRYCPASSELPQDYQSKIERISGVTAAIPTKVVVSNCRTSLDVVTYRGVPKDEFIASRGEEFELVDGSFEDWKRRTDAALVGKLLAERRNIRPGMTFDAAGITVYVAGIITSDDPQYVNAAYTALEFVQLAGRDKLGVVTQFNVEVEDASMLGPVADQIDELFRTAQEPTATFSEKEFVARIADDIVELVAFASWLGIGCLVAILALVANAIVLSVQSRVAEYAVLQTLGYNRTLIGWLIIAEGTIIALAGGAVGAVAAIVFTHLGSFALSVEGQSIPIIADTGILVSGIIVCASIGVVAGLVPAIQASRKDIASCFRAV